MEKNRFQGALVAASGVVAVAALPVVAAWAAAPAAGNRVSPGELIIEPPTLNALGFEWQLEGDANRNATVSLRYRAKGTEAWREGLPPLRLGGEEVKYLSVDYVAPPMFAGSVFDLEPATTYELSLRISDPDGVDGTAERRMEARTRAEPMPATGGRTFHVYPPGYQGQRQQPAFNGLLAAFNLGASHSDWFNSYLPRVQPGDVILVHAGVYKDARHSYGGGGMGALIDGTHYLTGSGTAERPIVIRAAGDGPVVFDGDGNGVLFDVTAGNYIYFEGITFRNTEIAILAGRKRIVGSSGLTVKNSRFEDVGIGITSDWSGSKDFYIADNVFIGRQIPDRLLGWIGRTWQNLPGFPVQILSNVGVKVYGSGHVVVHNDISHFHDGIDHATYGTPDRDQEGRIIRERMPVSIDIIGNEIHNVDDNCIEADGAMHNIRILRNRCFNHAHRALSAQPLFGGPAYFIGNVVYHAPEGGSLKFQANPAGLVVYHNTFFSEVHDMGPVSNVHYRNNLILGQGAYPEIFTSDTFTSYSSSDYNGFRPNPGAEVSFAWNSPPAGVVADFSSNREVRRFPTLKAYAAATGQDRNSILVDYGDFVRAAPPDPKDPQRFHRPDEYDFTLRQGSKAVDAGVVLPNVNDGFTGKAPDLGAYERGRPLPVYGPRKEKQ
ncbi:MAG TPA: hypothetical protein VNQ32_07430 [Steroidobacteraceae bacterium]|nr:hypothetical protein [Steroidobacteraceae bacterium]